MLFSYQFWQQFIVWYTSTTGNVKLIIERTPDIIGYLRTNQQPLRTSTVTGYWLFSCRCIQIEILQYNTLSTQYICKGFFPKCLHIKNMTFFSEQNLASTENISSIYTCMYISTYVNFMKVDLTGHKNTIKTYWHYMLSLISSSIYMKSLIGI